MRILYLASDKDILAILDDQKSIYWIDFPNRNTIQEFSGYYDTDQRFCIDSDSSILTVGSWKSGSIAYKVGCSRPIWMNRKLRKFTWYSLCSRGLILLTGGREISTVFVDQNTGKIVEESNRIDKLLMQRNRNFSILLRSGKVSGVSDSSSGEMPIEWDSFTVSNAAFSANTFLLSGPNGELKLFEKATGKIIEVCDGLTFSRADYIFFDDDSISFYAVLNEIAGSEKSALVKLGESLNEVEILAKFDPVRQVVSVGDSEIITSDWDVINFRNGRIENVESDFPGT